MNNYVISLQTEQKRREHITAEFSKQKIPFEFFNAITPDLAVIQAKKMGLKIDEQLLTAGEVACFMSHLNLWQQAIDLDLPYITIFEDDIFLGKDSAQFLTRYEWIPEKLKVIKLEAFTPKVVLGAQVKPLDSRDLFYLKGINLGAAGYILSLAGAKSLLAFVQNYHKILPLDHMIFELYLKENPQAVCQLVPALCIQELELNKIKNNECCLKSSLLDERHSRMKTYKAKGFAKIKKEAARLPLQLHNFLFARKVDFK
ncbi:glycosyltransferase family 25 protein [Acinetobacter nectaris]|uniref:glycosyltransferase family 25 protein n=1 Tax=Acinetobacter nectaris TaxID=1219382 RepID=UPI001F1DE42D|nr:glycosyltransferase family 25 protein [Acinetobacter nectaris]MCF9046535.1 glycosyltransferase family 25 protein [Acinetobacter nectaris]